MLRCYLESKMQFLNAGDMRAVHQSGSQFQAIHTVSIRISIMYTHMHVSLPDLQWLALATSMLQHVHGCLDVAVLQLFQVGGHNPVNPPLNTVVWIY